MSLYTKQTACIQETENRCMKIRTARPAFTLTEVLVVVAIIALLVSILLPSLSRAKEQARKVVCGAHMHDLYNAMMMYTIDHKGWTHRAPNHGFWDNAWQRQKSGDPSIEVKPYGMNDSFAYWGIAYFKYEKNREVWSCPSQERVDDWPEQDFGKPYQKYFKNCSYGLNGYIVLHPTKEDAGRRIDQDFKHTSQTIFFQDHIEQRLDSISSDMLCYGGSAVNLSQWRNAPRGAGANPWFPNGIDEVFRHRNRSQITWLDGHVSDIKRTKGENVPSNWYTGGGAELVGGTGH